MGPQVGHVAHEVRWTRDTVSDADVPDALHMIAGRLSPSGSHVLAELAQDTNQVCIGELRKTAVRLDREGFVNRPGWIALKDGQRPEAVEMWEPSEWHHGWQYYTSSCSECNYRETVVLAQSCATDQAHLRSHSGPGSADVFLGCPTDWPGTKKTPRDKKNDIWDKI